MRLLAWCGLVISSQLFYDGYKDQAVSLAHVIKPNPVCPPSDRLYSVFCMGYDKEEIGESDFAIGQLVVESNALNISIGQCSF